MIITPAGTVWQNKQQVFNKVVEHLASMTKPSKDNDPNGSDEERCVYRGPDKARCAIGALIPDNEYHESLEGKGADHKEVMDRKCFSELKRQDEENRVTNKYAAYSNQLNANFLQQLQAVHDSDVSWTDGEGLSKKGFNRLIDVAVEHKLDATCVVDAIFNKFNKPE